MSAQPEKQWPASKPEMWVLDKIVPFERNARTHPEAQIDALARDMLTDGVTMPILVDEKGVIIAGHGRLLAARRNGFKKYPVVIAKGWTEIQKKAARIKDNQRGLQSGWDQGLLKIELHDLKIADYDMPLLGFGEVTLVEFMTGPQAPAEFGAVDERTMPTEFCCPRCSYAWSGNPKPGAEAPAEEPAKPKRQAGK